MSYTFSELETAILTAQSHKSTIAINDRVCLVIKEVHHGIPTLLL